MPAKDFLGIDVLRKTRAFSELTEKQKATVEAFVSNGHNKLAAVQSAYNCKSAASARTLINRLFSNPAVVAVLALHFQDDPLDTLKAEVRRALRDKHLTPQRAAMLRLLAELQGVGSDSEKPTDSPVIADKVIERDGRRLRTVVTDLGAVEIS
jgi:hypothetical protein